MTDLKSGGQPGNTNPSKNQPWRHAIDKAITGYNTNKGGQVANFCIMTEIATKLLDMALEGDMPAIKELGDRSDGKPMQPIEAKVTEMTHAEWLARLDD